jgi:hypothetical protein
MAWSAAARAASAATRRARAHGRTHHIGPFVGHTVQRGVQGNIKRIMDKFRRPTWELTKPKLTMLQKEHAKTFMRHVPSVSVISSKEMADRLREGRRKANASPGWYAPGGKWETMRRRNETAVSIAKYDQKNAFHPSTVYQTHRKPRRSSIPLKGPTYGLGASHSEQFTNAAHRVARRRIRTRKAK